MVIEKIRKGIHLVLGVLVVLLYFYADVSLDVVFRFLIVFLFVLLVVEYFRIGFNWEIPFFHKSFREKERRRLCGLTYGVIAAIICLKFFSYDIAVAAILMGIFSDPVASIVGMNLGKIRLFKEKTFEGSLSAFIISLAVGFLILDGLVVIVLMALTATVVELFAEYIDDNLVIPLFSGGVGEMVRLLF